jgi:ferredoxin
VFDENRRFSPTFIEGSEVVVDCDTVVLAIGQTADLSWIRAEDELAVTPRGTLQADPETLATSRPDVFAGGDVAFGPRIVITAVAEGQRAARSIARYLTGVASEPLRRVRITTHDPHRLARDFVKLPRKPPPALPVDRRVGIAEVEQAYAETDALEQAARCLRCHLSPVFDGDKCVLCGGCADVCPESCLRLVDCADLRGEASLHAALVSRYGGAPARGQQSAILKGEARCIRCGLCAARCPTGAIAMERVEWLTAPTEA